MEAKNNITNDQYKLRQKAELILKNRTSKANLQVSEADIPKLIHELEVHQIELEMQNEELVMALSTAQDVIELYDLAPTGYFTLSRSGEIIHINLCGASLLGKERSNLTNSMFGFFISDDTKPIYNTFLSKVFNSKFKETCEVILSIENNLPFYVLITGIVSKNAEYCHISVIDITERKQAEETIKESEEKYRLIVENIGEGFGFVNAEEQFLLANKYAEVIFGVEPGGLVGMNLNQFLSKDQFHKVQKETEIREKGIRSIYELDIIRPNGEKRVINVTAVPKKHKEGSFIGTYGVFRDITEQKQAEEEIKLKNQELQNLNATKDKFFSIIAHDLRSPFNSFLGLTQVMAEDLPSLTMTEVQEIALSISKSASNLYRLLENLLHWSQIQNGALSYHPEILQLGQVVNDSIEMIQESAKSKGIEITKHVPVDLEAFADNNMLQTIIRNLVSNAVKFTPNMGKVNISVETSHEKNLLFSVQDNGIGMSQAMVENLFRIDIQTKRKGTDGEPSTGLGLLLCKEFVEINGGKIWAESREWDLSAGIVGGSTFYFTIPYNPKSEEELYTKDETSTEVEKPEMKKLKILIAEDDETSEMLISLGVEKFSSEIQNARTGFEAVDICRRNPDIDLVMMDIQMPDFSGLEATKQIREFNSNVIIIAQTAYALSGDREKALEAGCNDYIAKPIKRDQLLALINKYFNK